MLRRKLSDQINLLLFEIAMKGAEAKKERANLPKAICGNDNKKIVFGDIEIQCYVLEDETRVLMGEEKEARAKYRR